MIHTFKLLLFVGFCIAAVSVAAQDSVYARRIIRDLTSDEMYGRGMQNRGDSLAADYLRRELMANGVRPLENNANSSTKDAYYQYFRFPQTRTSPPIVRAGYRSQNVCGYIPGETDTMIVFTAHYEHLGMDGDIIFPGAHDNASGTAAVMDIARMANVFDKPRGEELALIPRRENEGCEETNNSPHNPQQAVGCHKPHAHGGPRR